MLWSLEDKQKRLESQKEVERKENESYIKWTKRKEAQKADYMAERKAIEDEK